jgi:thioredoxin reductase
VAFSIAKTRGFEKCINLNDRGKIIVGTEMQTNVPGVFAAILAKIVETEKI